MNRKQSPLPPKKTSKKKKPLKDETLATVEEEKKPRTVPWKIPSKQPSIAPTYVPPQGPGATPPAPAANQNFVQMGNGAAAQVIKWIQRALDMGVQALRDEYRALARYTLPEMTFDAFKMNHEAGRNRYQDVPCQDQHRVVLKWPGCPTDYVHANYVATPTSAKRFICTQGPLDTTVVEFWTMVIQEEATVIIMLCNVIECGKLKCAQYWPEDHGASMKFDAIGMEVTNQGVTALPNEPTVKKTALLVRYRDLSGKIQERPVNHLQWTDWPDRGVPPCKLTAMELLSRVRGTVKPIVVHCSAGIGRTGTIVAIEYIMERLFHGQECAAMDELLKMLRNQRAYSIQNDLQYLYIHRVILCYFFDKHKERHGYLLDVPGNKDKYSKFIEEYNQATGAQ